MIVIQRHHVIDRFDGGDDFHPLVIRVDGIAVRLDALDRRVGIDGDHQDIPQRLGTEQVAQVPNVQNFETAVGEHHFTADLVPVLEAHRKVGELISDSDAFLFVGCGEGMHEAVATANARGTDTLWFEDAAECGELSERLPLNAVILVKGSRSMGMERVITPLLLEGQR